jgi:hypothetical protein
MAVRNKFKLVQGDEMPEVWLSLTDSITGDPVDLSALGTAVWCHLRAVGSKMVKSSILCDKLPGVVIRIDEDTGAQTISVAPPYDVAGRGGRCAIIWGLDDLDTAGTFQGEIEVIFEDAKAMTWYDLLQFQVREQFA